MYLEAIKLEHVPETHQVYVAFFKDVQNSEFLQTQLVARNPAFEYAFIDATAVISRLHVLAATFRGIVSLLSESLKTPNVHSEIVACLSASNNIADTYKKFGITPSTKDVIIVKIVFPTEANPSPLTSDEIWSHLQENVKGTPITFTDEALAADTDWVKVHKAYKINGTVLARIDAIDTTNKLKEKEAIALGGMALRGT